VKGGQEMDMNKYVATIECQSCGLEFAYLFPQDDIFTFWVDKNDLLKIFKDSGTDTNYLCCPHCFSQGIKLINKWPIFEIPDDLYKEDKE